MTYTELLTKLRAYTEVDDTVLTDTILNGFIQDTEFKIFREVCFEIIIFEFNNDDVFSYIILSIV